MNVYGRKNRRSLKAIKKIEGLGFTVQHNAAGVPAFVLESARRSEKIEALLKSPLNAFTAAWEYQRGKRESISYSILFSGAVGVMCAGLNRNQMASLKGNPSDALDEFLKTVWALVKTWLPLRKRSEPDIRWSETYKEQVKRMQKAQQARIAWSRTPGIVDEATMDRPRLVPMQKIRGQRTFRQAGRTAAYILWGDFLAGDPTLIDFCKRCFLPFKAKSNKVFCPGSCRTSEAANTSRKSGYRRKNWERLKKAADALHQRLAQGYDGNVLKGIADGRWGTRFARAAENPLDVKQRENLIDLCTEYRSNQEHRLEVKRIFDQFLENIARAQQLPPF